MEVLATLKKRFNIAAAQTSSWSDTVHLLPAEVESLLQQVDSGVALKTIKHNVILCKFSSVQAGQEAIRRFDGTRCLPKLMDCEEEIVLSFQVLDRHIEEDKAKPSSQQSYQEVGVISGKHPEVEGLYLFVDFISQEEEKSLLDTLLNSGKCWEQTVHRRQPKNRRVSHFGYKFDYGTRRCDPVSDKLDDGLPEWMSQITARVDEIVRGLLGGFQWRADQLTVNEYHPGQGIPPHVDTHSAFEDGLASLSLGSQTVMKFAPGGDKALSIDILLPRRSLVVMTGPARFYYTHGIPQRKTDLIQDLGVVARSQRLSLTFRHIKKSPVCDNCKYPEQCDLKTE